VVFALALLFTGPTVGCVGLFAGDGSSVSVGTHAGGRLIRGVVLPTEGTGYRVPGPWQARGRQYGTEEMVRWLTAAFRDVSARLPHSVASLGDISGLGGGQSREHKSHGSGRDVDIFFYATDLNGQPYLPTRAMLRFAADGSAKAWSPPVRDQRITDPIPVVRFDARRNWALVRALLTDPTVEVQWIFIHRALSELMLREGLAPDDDPALVARAAALFHQPSDAQAHDDHMHVRVFCAPNDRVLGCVDRGPQRWWKKHWKAMDRESIARVQPAGRALAEPAISAARF
jgi:penicillin-insensitive murein DD-endopeptidase